MVVDVEASSSCVAISTIEKPQGDVQPWDFPQAQDCARELHEADGREEISFGTRRFPSCPFGFFLFSRERNMNKHEETP